MREILSKFMDQIKELIMVLMTFFVLILTSMVVSFFIEVFIESQRTKLEQKMGDTGILIGHGEILMVSYVACIIMILSLYGAKILLEEYFIKTKIKGSAGDFKNALNRADRMAKTSVKNTKEVSKKSLSVADDVILNGRGKVATEKAKAGLDVANQKLNRLYDERLGGTATGKMARNAEMVKEIKQTRDELERNNQQYIKAQATDKLSESDTFKGIKASVEIDKEIQTSKNDIANSKMDKEVTKTQNEVKGLFVKSKTEELAKVKTEAEISKNKAGEEKNKLKQKITEEQSKNTELLSDLGMSETKEQESKNLLKAAENEKETILTKTKINSPEQLRALNQSGREKTKTTQELNAVTGTFDGMVKNGSELADKIAERNKELEEEYKNKKDIYDSKRDEYKNGNFMGNITKKDLENYKKDMLNAQNKMEEFKEGKSMAREDSEIGKRMTNLENEARESYEEERRQRVSGKSIYKDGDMKEALSGLTSALEKGIESNSIVVEEGKKSFLDDLLGVPDKALEKMAKAINSQGLSGEALKQKTKMDEEKNEALSKILKEENSKEALITMNKVIENKLESYNKLGKTTEVSELEKQKEQLELILKKLDEDN